FLFNLSKLLFYYFGADEGELNPPSHAWQARIIATIRRPHSLSQEFHFFKKNNF
ncbi:hypothetical protein CPX_001690, partial [Candidatus Phytoplasma pruni]